jgi:hypothetical protein
MIHELVERGHAVVHVSLHDEGAATHAAFITAGMSEDGMRAKVAAIAAHHELKAARHRGFNLLQRFVDVDGLAFFIHGLAIVEHGTDVRLVLRVRTPDGAMLTLDRMFPTAADVPGDDEIVELVKLSARAWLESRATAAEHFSSVRSALGVVQ